MRSPAWAALVLLLIKLSGAVPSSSVMFLPPMELRTLDPDTRVFPFSGPFVPVRQRMMSQPAMSMQQHPITSAQQSHMTSPQHTSMMPAQQSHMMSPQHTFMMPEEQSSMISSQQSNMMSEQQSSSMTSPQQSTMMSEQQSPMTSPQQSMMSIQQPLRPPTRTMHAQPSVIHTSIVPPPSEEAISEKHHDHHNFTLNEIVEALNEITDHNEEQGESRHPEEEFFSRAADERDGYASGAPPAPYPPYPSNQAYPPRPYAPPRPSYQAPVPYQAPASYQAPSYATPPESKTVELAGLLKPISTKVAGKLSGLIGLLLALFSGSAPGDELTGFKDIIINGIVKPLLIAKGGIKSLVSKLMIPVIALLLINVEVLITVWWLWEECPKEVYHKPSYAPVSYPPPYHPPSSY